MWHGQRFTHINSPLGKKFSRLIEAKQRQQNQTWIASRIMSRAPPWNHNTEIKLSKQATPTSKLKMYRCHNWPLLLPNPHHGQQTLQQSSKTEPTRRYSICSRKCPFSIYGRWYAQDLKFKILRPKQRITANNTKLDRNMSGLQIVAVPEPKHAVPGQSRVLPQNVWIMRRPHILSGSCTVSRHWMWQDIAKSQIQKTDVWRYHSWTRSRCQAEGS